MPEKVHISRLTYIFICTHIKQTYTHTKPFFFFLFSRAIWCNSLTRGNTVRLAGGSRRINVAHSLDSTFGKINEPPGKVGAEKVAEREAGERVSSHRGGSSVQERSRVLRGMAKQLIRLTASK
jgi:hypothetical protein